MKQKNYLLDKTQAAYKLQRLALEVAECLQGDNADLIIIGIRDSGMVIADKINLLLKQYLSVSVETISVTFNKTKPTDIVLSKPLNFDNKNILLVDDVANSGKTLLYALKPLLNFYPKRIQTLVLVERMHKLFPIKPDFVGLSVATTLQDNIVVEVEGTEVLGAYVS
ncbi:MAG: phosphoribosyltransferase [Bacteroidetes bacterium]|nr:phosphoribosyltransferase [Bacteroidota bacterium]MBS1639364.1 phosphoribosyltransferase [Bacteroidota bacterium]MBS1642894.1 phosphoribosyltransferase [Bacteroidota bacterium]MBS1670381.1 phosphoribosyltransferase [Bacteroidota bacterium]